MPVTTDINNTLNERGSRYGKFIHVSKATQDIQEALYSNMHTNKLEDLQPDQAVALDMICHKLARIAVGDVNYVDNWVDIAGYAKLVADRLQGVER
jgi:predicted phosphatase